MPQALLTTKLHAPRVRPNHLLGFASGVRSWRARLRGEASEAVELARRALSLLPDEEAYLRNLAAVCLGDALWITGDLAAAGAAFAEAVEIGREAGHFYGTLIWIRLTRRSSTPGTSTKVLYKPAPDTG